MNRIRPYWTNARAVLAVFAGSGFAVFVAALISGPQSGELSWAGVHHAYLGAVLVFAGQGILAVSIDSSRWIRSTGWVLSAFGAILIADDALQHAVQRWAVRPDYRSPLHRLFQTLFRSVPWVARLNLRLDRLLGARK